MSSPQGPWSPCKRCDAMDFFRPGFVDTGVLFVSTEYNLGSKPYRTPSTLFLDRSIIERIIRESGLYVVAPMELRLTDHPFNNPLWSDARKKYDFVPHD